MLSFEAKNFIEDIIKKHSYKNQKGQAIKVVRDMKEEQKLLSNKQFPFVSLLTADGTIDERMAKTIKWTEKIPEKIFKSEYNLIISKLNSEKSDYFKTFYTLRDDKELYELNRLTDLEMKELINILEPLGYNKKYQSTIRGAVKLPIEIRVFAITERESNQILLDICRNMPFDWIVGYFQGKIMLGTIAQSDWTTSLSDCVLSSCVAELYMDIGTDREELPTIKNFSFDTDYPY